jgi:phosphopantothenoylcysteine synthetase/decarboxylase
LSRLKNVLLGLTGSISVSNIFPYIAAIQNNFNCRMHIMMTPTAQTFIPASTLIHSIDGDIFVDLAEKGQFKMPHIELTHWADAIIILPASATHLLK